jgi:hypothetical protein
MRLVNLKLMASWENWVFVFLVLLIGSFGLNAITKLLSHRNGDN